MGLGSSVDKDGYRGSVGYRCLVRPQPRALDLTKKQAASMNSLFWQQALSAYFGTFELGLSVHNLWKLLFGTLRKRWLLMAKGIDLVVRSWI